MRGKPDPGTPYWEEGVGSRFLFLVPTSFDGIDGSRGAAGAPPVARGRAEKCGWAEGAAWGAVEGAGAAVVLVEDRRRGRTRAGRRRKRRRWNSRRQSTCVGEGPVCGPGWSGAWPATPPRSAGALRGPGAPPHRAGAVHWAAASPGGLS